MDKMSRGGGGGGMIKAGGQKAKMKRWERSREERDRGVRLTGGWMAEEEVERGKKER